MNVSDIEVNIIQVHLSMSVIMLYEYQAACMCVCFVVKYIERVCVVDTLCPMVVHTRRTPTCGCK